MIKRMARHIAFLFIFSTALCVSLTLMSCGGGGSSNPVVPAQTTTTVKAIAAGGYHNCVVLSSGNVKCWGYVNDGNLENGQTSSTSTPTDVANLNSGVSAVSGGYAHTCVLMSPGNVKCWGWNNYKQLGSETIPGSETCDGIPCSTTPIDVAGL